MKYKFFFVAGTVFREFWNDSRNPKGCIFKENARGEREK